MRALAILFLLPIAAMADEASSFLNYVCMKGFTDSIMPRDEAVRFCGCIRDEVVPRLTLHQRRLVQSAEVALRQGLLPPADQFASSGIRELVVAGQARCEAAFYPPASPINVRSGALHLTLRCEDETKAPEAFIYISGLLTEEEVQAMNERFMKDDFEPEYARVATSFDGSPGNTERWDIDLSGEFIAPANPAQLIERLRTTSSFGVTLVRGTKRYSGVFDLRSKIPARWTPCGGVGR